MTGEENPLLAGLTDTQREAVEHVEGPLLVLAGPGSGKTTVVTRRIANLVMHGVPPWQILALTFTNKAAAEMRHRIEAMLPEDLPDRYRLTVSTFHAFGARLLRRFATPAGLSPSYTIYDTDDQRDAIKRALVRSGLSTQNWTPASVAGGISAAKNRLLDADGLAAESSDFYSRSIARIYKEYEKILRGNEALDFDDLLLVTARLLRRSEEVRTTLQRRFHFLLIDEYQDTNHAQFVIAHTLASAHQNICVVGDPDQSIYGWRGADISNILEFEEHYPTTRVIPLGENFRSTGCIVDAAAGLIAHNRRRKPKELFTSLERGESPQIVNCRNEHHEAEYIADAFRKLNREHDLPWKEMVVLYRVNALSRVIEDAFRSAQIPYVIARGTAFFSRKEVRDALAYLRLVANPLDEISLRRIVNEPPRAIGATAFKKIEGFAIDRQLTMLDALREAAAVPQITTRGAGAATKFTAMVDAWRRRCEEVAVGEDGTSGQLADLVERVVRESGLEAHYRKSRVEEEQQRVENLGELVSAAAEFVPVIEDDGREHPATLLDELNAFLESVTLVSDADAVDPGRGSVTLMTLHTAKGLEFDAVAIAGLEEGLLPHVRAATDENEREEERRLCFVGMTRARRHLLLTRAAVRTQRGIREMRIGSKFLEEIPYEAVQRTELADPTDWDGGYDVPSFGRGRQDASESQYEVGCMVEHPVFGVGRIESFMPRPTGSAARVAFLSGETKTLLLQYAKLTRVE